MSFLAGFSSFFRGVGNVAAKAQPYEGIIGTIPVIGTPADSMINMIMAVEALFPQAGLGAAKKTAVTAMVTAAHPNVTPSLIDGIITDVVAGANAIQLAAAKLPAS